MAIKNNVTWKELGDKVVAVNVESGEYYTMNATASSVWKLLAEGKPADEITAAICGEYEADPATVGADIDRQIAEWKENGLID